MIGLTVKNIIIKKQLKKNFKVPIMIFFTVNPIIIGQVLTAKKHVICWNITTYKNMDVKLLHPVWKDLLDTMSKKNDERV
jgi:protein gp37